MSDSTLRDLREEAGHTQAAVAAFVGVAQSYVSTWESGSASVPRPHLERLARLYGQAVETVEEAASKTRAAWHESKDTRLASTLRQHRELAGLTRAAVADACDVSSGAVTFWERAVFQPDRERLIEFADLVKTSPRELFEQAGYTEAEIADYLEPDKQQLSPLAQLLRQLRDDAGLTQVQVAAAMGIAQNSVSALETSHFLPDRRLLERLRQLYGADPVDLEAAFFESRSQTGQVPRVVLPWPLDPRGLPQQRWFRQLRAHLGLTRAELSYSLDVDRAAVASAENPAATALPPALQEPDVLRRLADRAGCTVADLLVAFGGERARDVAHLLGLEGRDLVLASATIAELLTVLNLYGVSWTTIAEVAGTSRQSPVNWANGGVPRLEKVRRFIGLFDDDTTVDDLEQLWHRTKNGPPGPPSSEPELEALPGTADWIFGSIDDHDG